MAGEAENDPGEAVTRAKRSTSSLCSTLYIQHSTTPTGFQKSHVFSYTKDDLFRRGSNWKWELGDQSRSCVCTPGTVLL